MGRLWRLVLFKTAGRAVWRTETNGCSDIHRAVLNFSSCCLGHFKAAAGVMSPVSKLTSTAKARAKPRAMISSSKSGKISSDLSASSRRRTAGRRCVARRALMRSGWNRTSAVAIVAPRTIQSAGGERDAAANDGQPHQELLPVPVPRQQHLPPVAAERRDQRDLQHRHISNRYQLTQPPRALLR